MRRGGCNFPVHTCPCPRLLVHVHLLCPHPHSSSHPPRTPPSILACQPPMAVSLHVTNKSIPLDTHLCDVCNQHFHGISDADIPLNSIPIDLEEGRKIVRQEDQAELNAAAVLANYSEWLQHKIETAKQEGGRLAVPELAEQCEEGSIGFRKSVIDELSADLVLVKSYVVYEDALRESASRVGVVNGLQLVSALHGDTALIQVTIPLQLRIEDGGCVGLCAEYEALPGFEAMGCLRSSFIAWSPCPQKGHAAPGAAVGAAVGSMHREKVSWKKPCGGDGRGEYRRGYRKGYH